MRKEYELRRGKPNPYPTRLGAAGRTAVLERFLRSEHFVRIDDDLVEAFADEKTVNETLRLVLRMNGVLAKPKSTSRGSRRRSA
jgi:hypothetical protein